MLSILGTIAKIIGLILLGILCILLLLILLILFVPIRYRVQGKFDGKPNMDFHVGWFLPFTEFRGGYHGELQYRFRLLGFLVKSVPEKKIKSKKKRNIKKKRNQKKGTKQENDITEEYKTDFDLQDEMEHSLVTPDSEQIADSDPPRMLDSFEKQEVYPEEKQQNAPLFEEEREEKLQDLIEDDEDTEEIENLFVRFFQGIRDFLSEKILRKVQNIFRKLGCTWKKVCDKIKLIAKRYDYYERLWALDSTQKEIELCKKRIGRAIKVVLPRRLRVNLEIGTEDPATTGSIMGIWGMLYPLIGRNVKIIPYFDQSVLRGDFDCKGKIRVFVLLIVGLKMYRDKALRKLIDRVKRPFADGEHVG